jgi:pimeloyl-ACP methyl ester carboxylesterase
LAQWRYLCTRKEIATSQIGLVGHSEGAIAAAIACHAEPAIAFAVLLAGPAVRGDSLILGQLERMARLSGAPDSAIQQAIRSQQQVYTTGRADTGWASLRSMLIADLRRSFESTTPEQRSALGNIDSTIAARAEVKMAQIHSPWFRQFILFDPAENLRGMRCPVLALFGSLDTQVPPAQNQTRMEKLFSESGNRAALCKLIPGANHLFQAAQTGSPMEYGSLKKEFAPGVLESISQWMLKVKNSKEN